MHRTGICGSDQHYYNHFANGDILVREPMALGHESSGVVEAVGAGVTDFAEGDRVALEVGLPCDACQLCLEGRYNICRAMRFRSSAKSFPHFQGTLQGRINHPAKWCHKMPASVTLEEGALLEPLSVAIHAVRRARLEEKAGPALHRRRHHVLVLGAGAVGLLTAAVLRTVASVASITVADVIGSRVEFAQSNGFADFGIQVPRPDAEAVATVEGKLTSAQGLAALLNSARRDGRKAKGEEEEEEDRHFDAVFECTGVEACVQTAIYATAAGGKVLLIGMGTPVQTLPLSAAALREVDLVGVFRYASTYQNGLDLLADKAACGLPDITRLVTHRFSGFDRVVDAFTAAGKPVDEEGNLVIKVMIDT